MRLTDWSAQGARTGVRKALGLQCNSKGHGRPYAADGETFYEMPVTEATAESASGTCGYTGTLAANGGRGVGAKVD